MPTTQQGQQRQAQERQEGQRLNAVIAKRVMSTLGRPDDFQRVQVRPLWQDHYRVNVLVGVDAASVKVAHSYFLVAEGDGNITASTPPLSRQY
jgi:hypothetical protein